MRIARQRVRGRYFVNTGGGAPPISQDCTRHRLPWIYHRRRFVLFRDGRLRISIDSPHSGGVHLKSAVLVLLVLAPSAASLAQEAGGFSTGPGLQPGTPAAPEKYETVVQSTVSPEWTQDRTFPGTRFWKLDSGTYEFE